MVNMLLCLMSRLTARRERQSTALYQSEWLVDVDVISSGEW